MGKWGYKPFENETATDFSGDLDEAPGSERLELLRAGAQAARKLVQATAGGAER
ncbi:DUF4259 domain-containing protein [Streptomyces sp. NPDC002004]